MMNLKGRDRQYTLMTYLVEQLKSSQPELLHWCSTLEHVQKVVGYSLKAINAEVEGKMETCFSNVKNIAKYVVQVLY